MDCMPPVDKGQEPANPSDTFLPCDQDVRAWTHATQGWLLVSGDTCLHLALREGHTDVARLLIRHGDDSTPHYTNSRGETPESLAMQGDLPWPPPAAPIELEVGEYRLFQPKACRGCSLFRSVFAPTAFWKFAVSMHLDGELAGIVWKRYSEFKRLWEGFASEGALDDTTMEIVGTGPELMFDAQSQEDLFARGKLLDCVVQRLAISAQGHERDLLVQFVGVPASSKLVKIDVES
eukprot:TRINITY_DN2865_c0_g1_i2.p1 TRINITY_DN2865_c0_g1~~TRINITY_DN2865_c0_g1_i2.p1  ORF type:complete len:235 (+),score=47.05 TRINITY_DN2865_c0_g1_i2:144-848(+)